jgi:ferredoxin
MEEAEAKRLPQNAPGKYYTTDECDGCAYCASVAPENFDFEKNTNTYFVAKQPSNAEEEEYVLEAKDDCPLDAIRLDGSVNTDGQSRGRDTQ